MSGKTNLIGLGRDELSTELAAIGEKPFRARQLWHWIYHRGVRDFAGMTTLGRELRRKLAENYEVALPRILTEQRSNDGTRKWLVATEDNNQVEAVYIPEEDRGAMCISSQVGCTLACTFCHTGTQRLVRNLTAGEIVGQFMIGRDSYGEWPSPKDGRMLSNVVMMGMGEPLFNTDNVIKALTIIMDGGRALGLQAADYALDLGCGAGDRTRGAGARCRTGDFAARGHRRVARRAGADQQEIPDRGVAAGLPGTIRRPPTRGASPSST